ncbi:hypothetical protein FPRO06_13738 [Fusarium proliferatum]|nr:hypothetical protein FPRO06_13738 [Fusarium proliferatum]
MRSSLIILAGIAAVQAAVAAPPANGHLSARERTVARAEVDSPGGKDWKRAELESPGGKDWKRAEVDSPGGKDCCFTADSVVFEARWRRRSSAPSVA